MAQVEAQIHFHLPISLDLLRVLSMSMMNSIEEELDQ